MKNFGYSALSTFMLAVVSTTAHAQSSVTIYGGLDDAITMVSQSAGTTTPGGATAVPGGGLKTVRMDSGVGPGTRLGIRGDEQLGDGLAAEFVLEAGFAVNSGALQQGGLLFGRQALVGISSTQGWSVTAGRQYSPLGIAFAKSDATGGTYWGNPLADSGHGVYESLGAAAGSGTDGSAFRVDNSVLGTEKIGNFTGKLMVATGDGSTGSIQFVNPALTYERGGLTVNASYARFRQDTAAIVPSASPQWLSESLFGGSYDFQFVKVFGGIYQYSGPTNTADLSKTFLASPFSYTWSRTRTMWIGGKVPLGVAGAFSIQLSRSSYTYPTGPEGKAVGLGLLYSYSVSKRTSLYASYGQVNNDSFARGPLFATISVVTQNGFGSHLRAGSIGIQHTF